MITGLVDARELVTGLREEWRLMWRHRVDDRVRAEGIADKTYERLFVDRGLILVATRDFKPPEFQDILEKHLSPEMAESINPSPARGGVRKFIREYIAVQTRPGSRRKEETRAELENMKRQQQLKHGGRGWLHFSTRGI